VFLINSRYFQFFEIKIYLILRSLLIPKLQSHFVEFLKYYFPRYLNTFRINSLVSIFSIGSNLNTFFILSIYYLKSF